MRLQTKGFKIPSGTIPLGKLNLIVGPNASGKTALLQSIRFLALGHDPRLGKKHDATARLMRGPELRVGLELDDGRTMVRGLVRKGRSLSADHKASWIGADVPEEHDLAITQAFGTDAVDVAEAVYIRALLDTPPAKRAERILGIVGEGDDDHVTKAKAIARLVYIRLAGVGEDRCPDDYRKLKELVAESQRPILDTIGPLLLGRLKVGGIVDALTWANAEKRDHDKDAKKSGAAKEKLETRLETMPGFLDDKKIKELEGERKSIEQSQGADQERQAETVRKLKELKDAREDLLVAEVHLKKASSARAELLSEGPHTDDRERLAEINKHLDELVAPIPRDASKIRTLRTTAATLDDQAQTITVPEGLDPEPLQAELAKAQEELRVLVESPWSDVERGVSLIQDAARASKSSKLSKVVLPIADRLKIVATEQLGGGRDLLKEKIAKAQEQLQTTMDAIPIVDSEIVGAQKRIADLLAEKELKLQEAEALEDGQGEEFQALRQEHDRLRTELKQERDLLASSLAKSDADRSLAKMTHEESQRDHASLLNTVAALEEAIGPGATGEIVPKDSDRLEEIESSLERNRQAQAAHDELKAIVDQLKASIARRDVYAAVEWAIKKRREEELSKSGSLVDTIKKFLIGSGRSEVPFIQSKKGSCEIGWRTETGDDVTVEAMSGAEWVLFTTGLSYAIMIARSAPIRILLVDAGEVDELTLPQLLLGIASVAEEITAAIVLTWFDIQKYIKGFALGDWAVIRIPNAENGGSQ